MRPSETVPSRPTPSEPPYEVGQHLVCIHCHSEIEITRRGSLEGTSPVFICCGEPMRPTNGSPISQPLE